MKSGPKSRLDPWIQGSALALASVAGLALVLVVAVVARAAAPAIAGGVTRFFVDPTWAPAEGLFGLLPMVLATLALTALAMALVAPLGLLLAVDLVALASPRRARWCERILGVLAGLPSIVLGLIALQALVPLLARVLPQGQSLFTGAFVLAIMILPTFALLARASLAAVQPDIVAAGVALGLSSAPLAARVLVPAARRGLFAALLVATTRALGETMVVLLLTGNVIQWPTSLVEPVRALTAHIALEMAYATGEHRAALFVGALVALLVSLVCVLLARRLVERAPKARPKHSEGPATNAALPAAKAIPAAPCTEPIRPVQAPMLAALARSATALTVAVLAGALWVLWESGEQRLSFAFLVDAPLDGGRGGGIGPMIQATLGLLVIALSTALPIGLATALVLDAAKGRRVARWIATSLDVLAAVPSIVFGLFGYALFARGLGLGTSLWTGGFTLALMILPLFVSTVLEGLRALPRDVRSAALSLGLGPVPRAIRVHVPLAAESIVTALSLCTGRALAETAALIFTSGTVDRWLRSPSDSGRSLSVHILELAMNVPGALPSASATALVLILGLYALQAVLGACLRQLVIRGQRS